MRALDQLEAQPGSSSPHGGGPVGRGGASSSGRGGRVAWRTGYESDEKVLGVALAFGIHALPVVLIFLAVNGLLPAHTAPEFPEMAKPVIAATLLKLGKPPDPSKLPDRIIPRAATAPKEQVNASTEPPDKKNKPDAGAPPPKAQESDITRLIKKTDPFAEDKGKDRPEEGQVAGVKEGTETDPNRVQAGDMYAAQLGAFLHDHWSVPTVISQGEANRLCAKFQIALGRNMVIWHLREEPTKKSGNDLFDDSARAALQALLDGHTPFPEPPPEVAEKFKGRTLVISMTGASSLGDSKCR